MPTPDRRSRLAGIFLLFALLGPSIPACGGGSTEPKIDRDFVGSGLFCAGEAFCNEDGDYSFTNSVLTLDPGTPDSMNLQYSVSGGTLNVSGTVSGVPFTAGLERI